MAVTKKLPEDISRAIANQVASHIEIPLAEASNVSTGDDMAPVHASSLGESFEVWKLIPGVMGELALGNRDLKLLARRSGSWHLQVRTDAKATAFVRSKPLGPDPDSWVVREYFESELAPALDRAIDEVDKSVPDTVEARLLCVSFQQVEVFWFVATNPEANSEWHDQIMIIRSNSGLPGLEPLRVMSSEMFLDVLAKRSGGTGLNL